MNFPAQVNYFSDGGFDSALHVPEHIRLVFEAPYELISFDANVGLGIQSPHCGRNVEAVYFREFARTEPMVAITASPVMTMTQGDGGSIRGLLPQSMGTGVRGLYAALDSADDTRLSTNP